MGSRGVGLGSTLLVTAIVAILGFALAAASVTHINLMSRTDNASAALDLARSTLQVALGHMCTDKSFKETVRIAGPNGAEGVLTFQDPSLGIPLSLNNLTGPGSALAADNQLVPLEGAYLVARAEVRGVRRQVRAIVHLPPFPFAAASDGPLLSPGNLVVGSLAEGQDPNDRPEHLLPADLLSNDSSPSALTLGPETTVQGDLHSSGGVSLDPGAVVGGRVLTGQDRLDVPEMAPAAYDPNTLKQPFAELEETYPETTFTGTLRREGNVLVTGSLRLDRALVFVTGNLVLRGGVKGSGVLVTLGDLTIQGQADVEADSRVAILCGGRLELGGSGPASSTIKGLVYSEAGVVARQLRLQGALVARNTPPVTVDGTRLLNDGVLLQPGYPVLPYPGPYSPAPGFINSDGHLVSTDDERPDPAVSQTDVSTQVWVTYYPDGMIEISSDRIEYRYDVATGAWLVSGRHSSGGGSKVPRAEGFQALRALGYSPDPLVHDQWKITEADEEPGGGAALPTYTLELDPAKLLPTKDRIRTLMWREGSP